MVEITDTLKREGWAQGGTHRGFHYFTTNLDGLHFTEAFALAEGQAVALCHERLIIEVPAEGFWPVPPRSRDGFDGIGACDICRLASSRREWHRDGARDALIKSLQGIRAALGPEAMRQIDFNFHAAILTPEVVCDAMMKLQTYASGMAARLATTEARLMAFEIARTGLQMMLRNDILPEEAFSTALINQAVTDRKKASGGSTF